MSCLHPYWGFFLRTFPRLIVFCLVLCLLPWAAEAQNDNVTLSFPVFNATDFSCTGIPSVVAYRYCWFNRSGELSGAWADVLPPTYNNIFPNQAGRMMYKTPITFKNADSTIIADWSTFFIFSVEHVMEQWLVGAGIAFLIAPGIDTPDDSASGGFGLFPMEPSTGQPTSGTTPMVIAVEFDTQMTVGIDTLDIPHVGIDLNSLVSINATVLSTDFYDKAIGMWIDYNNTLQTLEVYCTPVGVTDQSAAELKPNNPAVSITQFSSAMYMNRQAYIGISAGVFGGGIEDNKVMYWSFETSGFPPQSPLATWYQWWAGVSTGKKIGLIAGAVVGTIAGAYACAECLFFCFFKRIKNPATAAEQRWPVRRRTSLPGTRPKQEALARRKVRDSLSVAKPLDLWSVVGPGGEPAVEVRKRPESDLKAMADSSDDSSDSEGSETLAKDAVEGGGAPVLKVVALQAKEITPPQGETKPLAAERKVGPQVAKPQSPEFKKPSDYSAMKTEAKVAAPPIEKKPLQAGKESVPTVTKVATEAAKPGSWTQQRPSPENKTVGPQAAKPGSPTQQRPSPADKTVGPQAAKPGSPTQQRPLPAVKTVAPEAAKPGSLPQLRSSAADKIVAPQAAKPGSLPQLRPSAADKTVVPQAAKPGAPTQQRQSSAVKTVAPEATKPGSLPQRRPLPTDKIVAPQAAKPGSLPQLRPSAADKTVVPQAAKPGAPTQQRQSSAVKTVAPEATKPGSLPQRRPLPTDKIVAAPAAKPGSTTQQKPFSPVETVAPEALKPGSPPQQRPLPGDKTVAPQAAQPGSRAQQRPSPADKTMGPQAAKPSSPTQQKPSPADKTLVSQAAKPGSPPQQRPSAAVKTVVAQGAKPSSSTQQRPFAADKAVAPQAAKPWSPPKQEPLQGEKAKPDAGPQKVAVPQEVRKTALPAGTTALPQKSPPQGPGPSQVPRKEPPKAPRPLPQTSPKAESLPAAPKPVRPPSPQSPQKK